jgi:glutamate synthase (NADPH/NADH) large chain
MAQGAKPGEGGQLPGQKVYPPIAKVRLSTPGVGLISPPPHHDIYSIEDLAQLIFDLKQINPQAFVSVKLVAESGVGTVAAGVAKTYADAITVSGHDGGTGASPISSIRYAGIPWEMGLVETHQVLRANNLRDKVRLQTDGGLKTGLDIVKAAILGAESFGFGTAPLIALGCKFLRICHLNNCATGIATQNPFLREHHFKGLPESLETYFNFVATEIRELLAYLGAKSLEEIIGQTDLLEILAGKTEKQKNLALDVLLAQEYSDQPHLCTLERNEPYDKNQLAELMVKDALEAIETKTSAEFNYEIQNTNRSIGARISGEIAKRYGDEGLAKSPITFNFKGTAGQSFAVWNINGVHMRLEGDANDYVGKGMAGGSIVIYPHTNSSFKTQDTTIIGNTCLYGATNGKLFAAGQAGERFAVRNSGAVTVVEGVGNHCCEYMTDGVVVVLGTTGNNFGAGMTGGLAFVLDREGDFASRYNKDLVEILRIDEIVMSDYAEFLRDLVEEHAALTNSAWAKELLATWTETLSKFYVVKAKTLSLEVINDYKSKSISRSTAH